MKEYKLTVKWDIAAAEYRYQLTEYRGELPVGTYHGNQEWAAKNAEYMGIDMPSNEGDNPTPTPEPETPEPEETPTPEPETPEPETPETDLPETTN